jgi:hypothetical protein
MLTRTAAHYPNSGHTPKTLKIVAEDWFHSFDGKLTDRSFIEAISIVRRKSNFFPTESEIFEAVGIDPTHDCKICIYYRKGECKNLKVAGFVPGRCGSFAKGGKRIE